MKHAGHVVQGVPPEAPVSRRDHVHAVAVLYIGATVLLLLGAMGSQNNLLFAMVALALATLIVSGFIAGSSMMGLRLARHTAGRFEAGKPGRIIYTVENRNRVISAFALRVVDEARGPDGLGVPIVAGVEHAGPGETRQTVASVELPARGRWTLGPARIFTGFPFGVSKKSMRFAREGSVLVLPLVRPLKPETLEKLVAFGREEGAHKNLMGQGDELFALREYRPGDAFASIAWRASARSRRLLSREHAAPQPRRVRIRLHTSHADLAARADTAERAVVLAASVGRRLEERGFEVGLDIPSCGLRVEPAAVGRGDTWMRALAIAGDEPPSASRPSGGIDRSAIVHIGAPATGGGLVLDPTRLDTLTLKAEEGDAA